MRLIRQNITTFCIIIAQIKKINEIFKVIYKKEGMCYNVLHITKKENMYE